MLVGILIGIIALVLLAFVATLVMGGGDFDLEHFLIWLVPMALAGLLGWLAYAQLFSPKSPRVSPETQKVVEQLRRGLKSAQERRKSLEERLSNHIPNFRSLLQTQATRVRAELNTPRAKEAESELNEIARTLVGVDRYENEVAAAIPRWAALERRLERSIAAVETLDLGQARALMEDIEKETAATQAKLNVQLDDKIGRGVLADSDVDRKLQELRGQ
ncbi:MAG: hypothetical protein N2111_12035 [Candidatus Sumerlaeaceae bacterium]|nr:hypothetical protein [Candidatus Sumerlaeaceae bacterium]